jgi:acetyl-CoA acetyltransferase
MLLQKQETKITTGNGFNNEVAVVKVSREDQDEFAYHSHMKALKAQAEVNLTNKLFLSLRSNVCQ